MSNNQPKNQTTLSQDEQPSAVLVAKKKSRQKQETKRLLVRSSRQLVSFVIISIGLAIMIFSLYSLYYEATEPAMNTSNPSFFDEKTIKMIQELDPTIKTSSGRTNPFVP